MGKKTASDWNSEGDEYFKNSLYRKAEECYQKAVEIDPENENAWYFMGRSCFHKLKEIKAIKCFKKAVEINPENGDAWYYIGSNAYYKGNYEEAIIACEKTVKLNPDRYDAWYYMGMAYYHMGKMDRALDCLLKSKGKRDAWFYVGNIYNNKGDYENAIKYYEKELENDPRNSDAKKSLNSLKNSHQEIWNKIKEKRKANENEIVEFRGYNLIRQDVEVIKELENIKIVSKIPKIKDYLFLKTGFIEENQMITKISFQSGDIQIEGTEDEMKKVIEVLSRLQGLVCLVLDSKKFSILPDSIDKLKSLKELSLSRNNFSDLPESIGNLTNLRELKISSNNLKTLPNSLKNLKLLKKLNLFKNKIETFPDVILELESLEELILAGNELVELPERIGNLKNLQKLELGGWKGGNNISILPESVKNLKYLKELDLRNNNFAIFPEPIVNLTSLEKLFLNGNKIKFLPESIGNLNSLEILNIKNNRLISLPESIGNLPSLNSLGLEGNNLSKLTKSIIKLKSLKSLSVSNNPWEGEWTQIINQDVPKIFEICRKLHGITIFISHAWKDQNQYKIVQMSNYLDNESKIRENSVNKININKVYICERDLIDDIWEFMKKNVPKSHILLIIATEKSLTSKSCRYELFLAKKYNIEILPIKGIDISWKQMSQVNVIDQNMQSQGYLDLSQTDPKIEFKHENGEINNFNEVYKKLDLYLKNNESRLKNLKENRELIEKAENKFIDITNSDTFKEELKESIHEFKKINNKLASNEITISKYFLEISDLFSKIMNNEEKINKKIGQTNENIFESAKEYYNNQQWDKAIQAFSESKSICKTHGWPDGVKYAESMIEEIKQKNIEFPVVSFHGTNISQQEAAVLKDLESLTGKNFSHVEKIEEYTQMGFTAINKRVSGIGLFNCGLKNLPESIGNLNSLQTLNLKKNNLISLPQSIGNLKSLKELNLWPNNDLKTIPQSITNLESLEILNLTATGITSLPESIDDLKSLKELYLSATKLLKLPESIGNLKQLKVMDLRFAPITEIPDSIGDLTSLEILDLNENRLKELPLSLYKLRNLKTLRTKSLSTQFSWNNEWRELLSYSIPQMQKLCRERAPISIFISHSQKDNKKNFIDDLARNLENYDEIKRVFTNKLPEELGIQLFLFIATKDSINEAKCLDELNFALDRDIAIIPLKGTEIEWEDLKDVKLKGAFILSNKLGFEISKNIKEFSVQLYDHIKKYKRTKNVFEPSERIFNELFDYFKINRKILIESSDRFRKIIRENIGKVAEMTNMLEEGKITSLDYFIKIIDFLN